MELVRSEFVLAEARRVLASTVETILAEAGVVTAPDDISPSPELPTIPPAEEPEAPVVEAIAEESESSFQEPPQNSFQRAERPDAADEQDDDEESSPLDKLGPRERACALLACESKTNKQIAAELGIHPTTVRTHLNVVFQKLGVHSRHQLAAEFAPLEVHIDSIDLGVLSTTERAIFQGMIRGLANGQIAYEQGVSTSTIRTHSFAIRKKLGVSSGVELSRVAGAFRKKDEAAKENIRSAVHLALQKVADNQKPGVLQISKNGAKRVSDQATLETLYEQGYITYKMKTTGIIGLHGLVAALLMRHPESNHFLTNAYTSETAREILNEEVDVFLEQHVAA